MKLSDRWLREWIAIKLDPAKIADRLTLAGFEVSVQKQVADLKGVVVGEIVTVQPGSGADGRRHCVVSVGKKKNLDIVCTALNVAPKIKVPVALAGTKLPGGKTIEETAIAGLVSEGMLCSTAELGLQDGAPEIMLLDKDAKVGVPIASYLELDDAIYDFDVTPNRGDCLSVAGIARELAAVTGARLTAPKIKPVSPKTRHRRSVSLRAPDACPRYVGRIIEGVNPRAITPVWMRERLRRSGVRSIHPVVDVVNYVMFELGQPMHAFDLRKLSGGITVRLAGNQESLRLLDGNEIQIPRGALLIADKNGPVALAGIMGGLETAVGAKTQDLFLESAYFTPDVIAGRARTLGLQTESSQRFERGVDPALQRVAMERATALLREIVGGRPGPVTEVSARRCTPKRAWVQLRRARLERVLAWRPKPREVDSILSRLGMQQKKSVEGWRVLPPSYRFDIGIEADLIEEVARLYGYERLPSALPQTPMKTRADSEVDIPVSRLRGLLVDRDYQEVITYSFVDPGLLAVVDPSVSPARIANPISADLAAMRTTLWLGLLQTILYNENRQQTRMRIFEIGRRFVPRGKSIDQSTMVAGAVTGSAGSEQWGLVARRVDFYDVKADVEALLKVTRRDNEARFLSAEHPGLHPGQTATIELKGERVGLLGTLNPTIQARLKLAQPVILFEIELAALRCAQIPHFEEISRFPAIRRDLAVVVAATTPAQAVVECLTKVAGKLLVKLELFDEYRGEGIDSGRKSLALGLTLQDSSRTLKEAEVDAKMTEIVATLQRELGAQLRR